MLKFVATLLITGFLFGHCLPGHAQTQWAQEINDRCASCHDMDLVCENLEKPPEYWEETLERMVQQWGVDLEPGKISTWAEQLATPPETLQTTLCPGN